MAYAGALFADACLRGLEGETNVEEYSYVASSTTELPFFSTKVTLGKKGKHSAPDLHKIHLIALAVCSIRLGLLLSDDACQHCM